MEIFKKEYIMTNPEIFRRNNFNRCRHCGQYFEQGEIYYFKCMNGDELQSIITCKYDIENFYIHKSCYEENYNDMRLENFIYSLFNKSYPRAKNKLTPKQISAIETIKKNCKEKGYYIKEKSKYIYIDGLLNSIKIKGKYNKITMKFESAEKGFNLLWLTQNAYLNDLSED